MKKKLGLFLFILAVSSILLTSSVYFHYNSLVEADFLYRGLKFESSDLEDLFIDKQNIWDLKPTTSFTFSLLDNVLRPELATFSSIHSSFDPFTSILRC